MMKVLRGLLIGLVSAGLLSQMPSTGARADIAVFDPDDFGEATTLWQPNQTALGMKFVLVNGALVLDDGVSTNVRPGRVLRQGSA